MDEILQKLLSSELLSEDAKTEISTQWNASVDQFKNTVREEVSMEVRAEIAEQWASERDTLIENVDAFLTKSLTEELNELRADIERFRDLEAEYAEKLVESRHEMADKLTVELDQLVDKMDAFFELRLNEEFEELREDIEIVKQNEFGRRIFEAFSTEFNNSYVDEDSIQSKLAETTAKLDEAHEALKRLEDVNSKMVRESKLEKILAPLNGKKREQMQFVLANIETSRLEEAYKYFITRVLKEDEQPAAATALTESTTVVTGDDSTPRTPVVDKHASLKKLAGIN